MDYYNINRYESNKRGDSTMTKLPLLAGVFMMSTILSSVGAIDVNIPGADSKIPKDAYINYKTTNPDIERDVANYVETLKSN